MAEGVESPAKCAKSAGLMSRPNPLTQRTRPRPRKVSSRPRALSIQAAITSQHVVQFLTGKVGSGPRVSPLQSTRAAGVMGCGTVKGS